MLSKLLLFVVVCKNQMHKPRGKLNVVDRLLVRLGNRVNVCCLGVLRAAKTPREMTNDRIFETVLSQRVKKKLLGLPHTYNI